MPLTALLATTIYFQGQSGELAGMGNTILKPKATLGLRAQGPLAPDSPWWIDTDLRAIFGNSLTGSSTSPKGVRELRADGELLFTLRTSGTERASVGPWLELALPTHGSVPYVVQTETGSYSAEEGDVLNRERLIGADFRFDTRGEKLQASLHNILFVSGTRIGPNLSTYKPLLGLAWENSYALIGTTADPVLSLRSALDFYFAHKAGAKLFNGHDGIGGTKRELDVDFGLSWRFARADTLTVDMYGTNNLNRGSSTTLPIGYRDGFMIGVEHRF